MSARTIHDRLVEALTKLGGVKVKTNPKTTVWTVPTHDKFFYLGRVNSLRYGATLQASIPVDRLKAHPLSRTPA